MKIINDNNYIKEYEHISNELDKVLQTDFVNGIYCERYILENAKANIVMVHGFTEYTKKYTEMIWYYRCMGFNVFIYDAKGHGFSPIKDIDSSLIHIDSFEDYVIDLENIIKNQVEAYTKDLPLYLFCHSMGGGVAALYMAKHPDKIKRAIMSSPMIVPKTRRISSEFVLFVTKCMENRHGPTARFPHSTSFDVTKQPDKSNPRKYIDIKKRIATAQYHATGCTIRWMHECLSVKNKILKNKRNAIIKTKVLILSAQNDTLVNNTYQKKFAKQLKNCRFVTIKNAKHNIFFSKYDILCKYYREIFEFLN